MTDDFTIAVRLCPKGHPVGTAFGGGYRCSGKTCGKERAEARGIAPTAVPQTQMAEDPEAEVKFRQRRALAKLPITQPEGDAATEWSKQKLQNMLPEAVARIQWDLRYGSDKAQSEAAMKVLAANGMDKREAAASRNTPTIVVNIGTGDSKAPWLERLKKTESK